MIQDDTFRIALFGHRDFSGHSVLEDRLGSLLSSLFAEKEFIEIYVGRSGEFDIFSASVVKRTIKNEQKNGCELVCALPYRVRDIEFFEKYYDGVIIPECVYGVHPKAAITVRNKWMVDIADLIVVYVESDYGGAYNAMQYAKRACKAVVNLAEDKYSKDN